MGQNWGSVGPPGNNVCLSARDGKWYHTECSAKHVFVCQKGKVCNCVCNFEGLIISGNLNQNYFYCRMHIYHRVNYKRKMSHVKAYFMIIYPSNPRYQYVSAIEI